MEIQENWPEIRQHFRNSFSTNFHVSIASVDENQMPTVTPIGSLFLNRDQSGFYFEKFPTKLPNTNITNKNICVLIVNSGTLFWLKALFVGKFKSYPAIKLYGQLGEKRMATEVEIKRLKARMRITRWLKGNNYLWGTMDVVRDITFTNAEIINLGKMTKGL